MTESEGLIIDIYQQAARSIKLTSQKVSLHICADKAEQSLVLDRKNCKKGR